MIDWKGIQNIIFDCDGVIFDSNALKSIAFERTLIDHAVSPADMDTFISYHKKYGGISRYIKLKFLITDILQIPFEETFYRSLLDGYAKRSLESYYEANFTDGCLSFFEVFKNKNTLFYVASGSDENELKLAFKKRNIDQNFEAIYGSPKTKREIIKNHILPGLHSYATVFIGDAPGDMDVAMENGLQAIAMTKYSENKWELLEKATSYNFTAVETLEELI